MDTVCVPSSAFQRVRVRDELIIRILQSQASHLPERGRTRLGMGMGMGPLQSLFVQTVSSDGPQMMVGGHWVGEHFGPCTSARCHHKPSSCV
jgi:hypothetical protein